MHHSRQIILSMLSLLVILLTSCAGATANATNSTETATNQSAQTSPISKSSSPASPISTLIGVNPTASATIQSTEVSPTIENSTQPVPTQTSVPSGLPNFSHVFIIVMENKEASQIVGNRFAPYINQLANDYARAADFYATSHPSLPNYLALTGGDTFGISSDCNRCYVNQDNIASQLETAGKTWKAYMESMPNPCFIGDALPDYRVNHDPFIYYDNIRTNPDLCNKVVPFSQFAVDLQSNSMPDFVWITPNTCNDMHNCAISVGDSWLKTWVPKILASSAWKNGGVLFITFDEGTTRKGCCSYAAGGKVDTLVISPLVKIGYVSNSPLDQYSLLKTIETSWNLPLLGKAASESTPLMSEFFSKLP
jgi:hypothetical protein